MLDGFLRKEDLCFTLMNEIAPRINVKDFEGMYKEGGRPPISPKVLLLVLIMQFLEKLSDRAAAQNLRYRIDWKVALQLELDFRGIHPTTLVKFRDRLLADDKASYAFDKVISHLVEQRLVRKESKQRIDSTHIVGKVRELSRLELFHETLRLFCADLSDDTEEMPSVIRNLHSFYVEEMSIRGFSEAQKKKSLREAGVSMRTFVDWAMDAEPAVLQLKSFKTMKSVFEQNFEDTESSEPKLIDVATGAEHICSPHEPDARYANKGGKKWIGYKAQIAETIGAEYGQANFITHADVNDATAHDSKALTPFIEEQQEHGIAPMEIYGDTHYNTSTNIESAALEGIELKGPVAQSTKPRSRANQGFEIDRDKMQAKCPANETSEKFTILNDGKVKARFSRESCEACEFRADCQPNPLGKQIEVRLENETLAERRREMDSDEFRQDMHKRNGIEGTLSGLVRGQGMRICRYLGKEKTRLQIKMSAASANIRRLHRLRLMNSAPILEYAV